MSKSPVRKESPSQNRVIGFLLILLIICAVQSDSTPATHAAGLSDVDTRAGRQILAEVKELIKSKYYDPNYHGIDLDTQFSEAQELIKNAKSNGQIYGIIAWVLLKFNDSHLYFVPPHRVMHYDYGFSKQMIGENCFVTYVLTGSDAASRGLKPGDEILRIDDMKPSRDDFWKIEYLYGTLRPPSTMTLEVRSPRGEQRELTITGRQIEGHRDEVSTDYERDQPKGTGSDRVQTSNGEKFYEAGADLFIWKFHSFDADPYRLSGLFEKLKKHKALTLDLRRNRGGYEETMRQMVGMFLLNDTKICDLVRRKERKPLIAKSSRKNSFQGKLIVLIDSKSSSASEVFARTMQLEHRATIVGDKSPGRVMRALWFELAAGGIYVEANQIFGISMTDADMIMPDGKSLENNGVIPDETVLITAADLADHRDTVMSHAAELAGVQLDAKKAWNLFGGLK